MGTKPVECEICGDQQVLLPDYRKCRCLLLKEYKAKAAKAGLLMEYTLTSFDKGRVGAAELALAIEGYLSGDRPWLVLCGPMGLGKTHILHAIGHEALTTHKSVLVLKYAQWILKYIRPLNRPDRFEELAAFHQRMEDIDLLLLDDLTPNATDAEVFIIKSVLDVRYERRAKTVFTTNYSPSELKIQYEGGAMGRDFPQLLDRMTDGGSGRCRWLMVGGENYRHQAHPAQTGGQL